MSQLHGPGGIPIITARQFQILEYLYNKAWTAYMTEMKRELGFANMYRVLQTLEDRGFIDSHTDPKFDATAPTSSRVLRQYALTPEGRKMFETWERFVGIYESRHAKEF
jgi:DNA-binding PadR family transcriptional regulator